MLIANDKICLLFFSLKAEAVSIQNIALYFVI